MTAITSCTPEENDDVKPSMTFSPDGAGITADKTVAVNAPLLFKVSAIQNQTTKKNLQSLRVQSFMNNTAVKDTLVTINDDSYLGSFNFNAPSTSSTEEKYTFTLTDKAGETTIKTINITTQAGPSAINSYSAKLLGGQSNPTNGSYFNATTGAVLAQLAANAAPASVDFIFAYGTTNEYYIGAPSNGDIQTSFSTANPSLSSWSTKNLTTFTTTTITGAEFDAMTDDSSFPTVGSDTKVNMLAGGDVFAFRTAGGKVGLVKVNSTSGTIAADREIDIDVKVQQ